MAGLLHSFYLVNLDQYDYWSFQNFYHQETTNFLHDDVVHYMEDSLKWIRCYSPAVKTELQELRGLDFYGVTVIKEDGARAAKQIFSAWAELFSQGPEILSLTGPWGWIEGEPPESGRYSA